MNHPRMTTRGRAIAGILGALIALSLPKKVECGYPTDDNKCGKLNVFHRWCTPYEVEPLAFYMLEHITHSNVGFAYSSDADCR